MDFTKVPILNKTFKEEVTIPKEYYHNTSIVKFPAFPVEGQIYKDENQDFNLELKAKGYFVLTDAINLEEVNYPFDIQISEKITDDNDSINNFIKNRQNTLDIIGILWENIVLEIPISFTTHEIKNEYHEGWELIGNEKTDSRLTPLKELLDKEKE